jgi:uncharacterized protein YaiE (UPF0345 family)
MATAVKGKFCKVEAGTTSLPAVNWNLSLDGNLDDISNFRDGRKRVGTLDDATLTFSVVEDEDATTLGAAGLKMGDTVTVKCYTNNAASKFFIVPSIIGQVTPKVDDVTKALRVDFSASLSGTIVWPT